MELKRVTGDFARERDDQAARVNTPANYVGAWSTVNLARTLPVRRRVEEKGFVAASRCKFR